MTDGRAAAAPLRFEILGEVRALRGATPVDLGAAKQRAVLAVLLLHAGRPVPVPQIVDAVWGDEPPENGANVVQKYVAGLRRVLDPDRAPRTPGELLALTGSGYLLRTDDATVDAEEFHAAVARATTDRKAGRFAEAASALRAALRLWRGDEALAGLSGPAFDAARSRLAEARATAWEKWADIELAQGRDTALIPDLVRLVEEFPLREGLRAQLMIALHQGGRQAEALAVFRDAREYFLDQFGSEPGDRMRETHQRILRGERFYTEPVDPWAESAAAPPVEIPFPSSGQPSSGGSFGGQPSSSQPFSGQQSSGQPFAGQQSSGQPFSGQQSSGQPFSGQPSSGAHSSGQAFTGQPPAGQSHSGLPSSGQHSGGQPSSGQGFGGQPPSGQGFGGGSSGEHVFNGQPISGQPSSGASGAGVPYPFGGGHPLAPAAGPARRRRGGGVFEIVLAVLLPLATCGFGGWVFFLYAALRHRRREAYYASAGYGALWVVGVVLLAINPTPPTAQDLSPQEWSGLGVWLLCAVMAAVHGAIVAAQARSGSHVWVLRDQARQFAAFAPDRALQLGIGRPGVPRVFDDGGLIDLNHVPSEELARAAGLSLPEAHRIVTDRLVRGPFHQPEDLVARGLVTDKTMRRLSAQLICIPPARY